MSQHKSYHVLLRIAGFKTLIMAATFSRLAGRMFILTLVLFTIAKFSSPVLAGWMTFAAIVPGLLVSPVAGVILDRLGPTIAIRIDMLASAIFVTIISVAGWNGWATPYLLFTLVTLYSLTGPLGAAGTRTLLPRIVSSTELERANALDTVIYAAVDVIGPALAGAMVAWLGPEMTILIIAASYGCAALSMSFVPRLPGLASRQTAFLRQAAEGVMILVRQPTLRGLAISYSLYQVTWGALYVVVPVFVANHYDVTSGSSITGFLWAAVGIAGGVGALFIGQMQISGRERHIMATGMIITALATWPVAAEFGFGGLALGLMLAGVMSGPVDVALLTLRQRRTDPQQLGRIMSISMSLNLIGFPLGSALAGMIITSSLSSTFILAGIASVMAAIATVTIPSYPAMNEK